MQTDINNLNLTITEYDKIKHQLTHLDTFRNELTKEREAHQNTRKEFEDKIKKLVITGVASLPERFKSVFEERLTKVENFRQLANLLVSILKKHYEEE